MYIEDFVYTTVTGTPYTDSATSITVSDASVFADPATVGDYEIVVQNKRKHPGLAQNNGELEVMLLTARDTGTNTLTVTRNSNSKGAVALGSSIDWIVYLGATQQAFDDKADLSGGNSFAGVQDFTGRIDADAGISFDSGTNVLDAFEVGTWTPAYEAETNSFDSISYDTVTGGKYYKFKKLVIAPFRIMTDSITKGTAADRVFLTGLPYPVESNSFQSGHGFVTETSDFATNHPTSILPRNNESKCNISFLDNTGSILINVSDLSTSGNANNIIGLLIYITS